MASLGTHLLDNADVVAFGDEADILAIGLGSDGEMEATRQFTDPILGQIAKGEAQKFKLPVRRGEEKITLITALIGTAEQFRAVRTHPAPNVVAGGQGIGA